MLTPTTPCGTILTQNQAKGRPLKRRMLALLTLSLFLSGAGALLRLTPATAQDSPTATIGTVEFAFTTPESLPTGHVAITLDNQGQQAHHLLLFQIADGYTLDDVVAHLDESDTPAFLTEVGAIRRIVPGASETVTFDLVASNYLLACFLPDTNTGLPHAALGMIALIAAQ